VHEIASKACVGVDAVIYEHLFFKKECAWWIPRRLVFNQKPQYVGVYAENLQFEMEEKFIPVANTEL
jgi:hypothetical protein